MKKILLNWKHFWVENYRDYSLLLTQYPHVMLAPPAPLLSWFAERHPEQIVAQEVTPHALGAHTGALGPAYLKKLGVFRAIVGHQEQRVRHHSQEYIEQQYCACRDEQINPILCIGERDKVFYHQQITEQLEFLKNFSEPVSLAYEPLWAIGQQQHCEREHVINVYDEVVRILGKRRVAEFFYGGSILGGQNELLHLSHLSGFFIGRLSLDLYSLEEFIKDYQQHITQSLLCPSSF